MQESAFTVLRAQLLNQRIGVATFGRAKRSDIPLGRIAIFIGNKRRLTTHRQSHIARNQIAIHFFAEV